MECSEEDIFTIAGYNFDWKRVGRRLLNDQKVRDIDNEGGSEEEKRETMLLDWKSTKSRDATYQALVNVLRAIENNATADRVEELKKKSNSQGNNISSQHMTSSCVIELGVWDKKHVIKIVLCEPILYNVHVYDNARLLAKY